MSVYLALFNPDRGLRVVLEALAGRDVRKALHMFTDILISGHLKEDRIFQTKMQKASAHLPEWLVVRILMRTNYRHYASDHGYVLNLLDVDPDSVSTTNFLTVDCLEFLAERRKKRGEINVEGYVWVRDAVNEIARAVYTPEDVMWALERLLNFGLITADHLRTKDLGLDDYVKIAASGFVHLRVLLRRSEYLNTAATDCWFTDKGVAEMIRQTLQEDPFDLSGFRRKRRLDQLEKYLKAEADRIEQVFGFVPPGVKTWSDAFDLVRAFFTKQAPSRNSELS